MSSNSCEEETNIDFDFNNQNTFMENESPIYLTKSESYAQHKIDNNQGYNDAQGIFTDLQSCTLPVDDDAESSWSSSSDCDDDNQPVKIYFSSFGKDDFTESNEDYDISKNDKIDQQATNKSDSFESPINILDLIRDDLYKFVFMPIPRKLSNYVQCRLTRDKSGLFQTFRLEIEYGDNGKTFCLLTAEKQMKISGQSQYTISVISKFSNHFYSAELSGNNITGTSYELHHLNGDERQQLAVILYEANFLGFNGPRKMEALLPKFDHKYYSKEQNDEFIRLRNKSPKWDPITDSYTLKFDGKDRIAIPSVKNFQMLLQNEECEEQIVMQFGRMSENTFSCDLRYPLSLIQAFAIALSAIETRLFRE